jgi:hypothetical protein
VHVLAPLLALNVPTLQLGHVVEPAKAAKRPATHDVHTLLPVVLVKVPGEQSRHVVCPERDWYWPGLHSVQGALPSVLLYEPTMQGWACTGVAFATRATTSAASAPYRNGMIIVPLLLATTVRRRLRDETGQGSM